MKLTYKKSMAVGLILLSSTSLADPQAKPNVSSQLSSHSNKTPAVQFPDSPYPNADRPSVTFGAPTGGSAPSSSGNTPRSLGSTPPANTGGGSAANSSPAGYVSSNSMSGGASNSNSTNSNTTSNSFMSLGKSSQGSSSGSGSSSASMNCVPLPAKGLCPWNYPDKMGNQCCDMQYNSGSGSSGSGGSTGPSPTAPSPTSAAPKPSPTTGANPIPNPNPTPAPTPTPQPTCPPGQVSSTSSAGALSCAPAPAGGLPGDVILTGGVPFPQSGNMACIVNALNGIAAASSQTGGAVSQQQQAQLLAQQSLVAAAQNMCPINLGQCSPAPTPLPQYHSTQCSTGNQLQYVYDSNGMIPDIGSPCTKGPNGETRPHVIAGGQGTVTATPVQMVSASCKQATCGNIVNGIGTTSHTTLSPCLSSLSAPGSNGMMQCHQALINVGAGAGAIAAMGPGLNAAYQNLYNCGQ